MAEGSKRWEKTSHAGLVRHVPTGRLYACIRLAGKRRWKSLDTDVLTVASLRLADYRRSAGARLQRTAKVRAGRVTLGDAGRTFLEQIGNGTNKPRTKAYYGEVLKRMEKSWPNWAETDCRRVTESQCREWAGRINREFSASVYNHAMGILRTLFDITVELGARYDNPALRLKRLREKPKKLHLPDVTQIDRLIQAIDTGGSRWSKPCANLVRFLMYGGFRKTEAAHVRWRDIDLVRRQITVHGDPETGTKKGWWSPCHEPSILSPPSREDDIDPK